MSVDFAFTSFSSENFILGYLLVCKGVFLNNIRQRINSLWVFLKCFITCLGFVIGGSNIFKWSLRSRAGVLVADRILVKHPSS